MPFQIFSNCARIIALVASERLFSTVNQHMTFQMGSLDAWVSTLFADVGYLFLVLKCFDLFGHLQKKIFLFHQCQIYSLSNLSFNLQGLGHTDDNAARECPFIGIEKWKCTCNCKRWSFITCWHSGLESWHLCIWWQYDIDICYSDHTRGKWKQDDDFESDFEKSSRNISETEIHVHLWRYCLH